MLPSFYEVPYEQWMFKDHPKVDQDHEEEKVRQWVLRELRETYHYPADWFGIGKLIDIEYPVQMGVDIKFADIAICTTLNERRKPFVFIETKAQGIDIGVSQLHSYLAATITANIGMWTNSLSTKCFRKQVDPNDIVPHPDIPDYAVKQAPRLDRGRLVKVEIPIGAGSQKTGVLTPVPDFEAKLFKLHSVLRDEENLHPDEALDEVSKFLYVKIYDEVYTKKDEDYVFQTYRYGSAEQLGATIRALYEEVGQREKEILGQQGKYDKSRTVFDEPMKVKDSTIYMIVEELQSYSLTETSIDARGRAFERFLGSTFRGALGQYFTPEPVVNLMIGILDPSENDLIIDPACGSGRFLTAALRHVAHRHTPAYGDSGTKILIDFARNNLHGIEISRRLVRVAVADMMLYDDGRSNIRCTDGLDSFDNYNDVSRETYSVVVTNPPFGSKVRDENVLARFALGQGRKSQDKEILFLNRCFELLKSGGRFGIVLPDGVLVNSGKNEVNIRKWYRDQAKLVAVIALPFHTFVPFGANAKTHLAFFRKWRSNEDRQAEYETYVCEVDDIGYDSAGNFYGQGEVAEVISDFHSKHGWD
jgi:type I restriction enzyme M protein